MAEKSIAKNTVFLYFRMMIVMFVSLYTSRVILDNLGVRDYGIYQAVGGIVTLFSFLNSALSSGTSRYLMVGIGKNDEKELKKIFSTLLLIHIILAIVILFFSETIGLYFLKNKIVIENNRRIAANFVYQFSVITCFFTITQVPYTSIIIAHEELSIYAYVGIIEVLLKLLVAYFICCFGFDKLIFYACMLFLVQALIIYIYRFFCIKKYTESHFNLKLIDLSIFKSVAQYSGWSLFANAALSIVNQGTLILLNNFFNPVVVTARSVSLAVINAANQFVNNFRTAANPRIIKKYALGEFNESETLLLESTSLAYYLMLIIAVPLFILSEQILKLWLGNIPEYSVVFLKWGIAQSLIGIFDSSLYVALMAKGRLKENALISPMIGVLQFPISFVFFRLGYSPVVICYVSFCVYAILSFVVKPVLLYKIVNYSLFNIYKVIIRCIIVTVIDIVVLYFIVCFFDKNTFVGFLIIGFLSVLVSCILIFLIGLSIDFRSRLVSIIRIKK